MSNELRSDTVLGRQLLEFIQMSERREQLMRELTAINANISDRETFLYRCLASHYKMTIKGGVVFRLSDTQCVQFRSVDNQNMSLEYNLIDIVTITNIQEPLPAQFGEVIE